MCAESLEGVPERCFRCETPLADWWRFEEALGRLPAAGTPTRPPPGARVRDAVIGALVAAAGLIAAMAALGPDRNTPPSGAAAGAAPVVVTVAPPSPAPRAAPAAVVRYHVQHGDSLSRIAARLTGDGRRWRELWPERARSRAHIQAGEVLEVRLKSEPSSSSE
jgi:nucleoid-associated protein YgaU